MSVKVVFMRRTIKESEIFGGEVYIDIDGKNIGKLNLNDLEVELDEGKHKIKMYKSHTYDTFIGIAETELNLTQGNDLLVKYSAPMLINQQGNIIVSDYKSKNQVDLIVNEREQKINHDYTKAEQEKKEIEEKNKNGIIIFIIILILSSIFYAISIIDIYSW